jgi:hypothetical protein
VTGFENPRPSIRPAGPRLIETLEPIVYHGDGFAIVIPAGFFCDGASVPKLAWALLRSHWIDLMPFGCLHDWAFRTDATILVEGEAVPVPSWWWANREGCNALATLGDVQKADVWKVRPALTLGSWPSWHKREVAWRG